MELRPYQVELYQRARQSFAAGHRRICIQMGTGGGKTPVGAAIVKSAASKGGDVWMACHKNFLVEQASDKLRKFGVYHGIVASGIPYDARHKVHVCSLGVLTRRAHKMRPPRLMLWDECHHLGARTWTELMNMLPPETIHVGLTATPIRPKGGGLGDHFTDLIIGPSPADLIQWGKQHPGEGLCDYRMFSTLNISADHLKTRGGDFATDELGELMDKPKIIGDVVAEMKRLAPGRKFLNFAPTIAFSEHVAERYRSEGINCVHLDGDMDRRYIKKVVQHLEDGVIQGISSRDIFLEGLDVTSVSCVQWTRHTKSRVVKMQGDGRGMRNEIGKDHLLILDHVKNWERFGLPDDPVEWVLDPAKPKVDAEVSTTRECNRCFCRFSISKFTCPECGAIFQRREIREIEQVDGKLEEIDKEAARASAEEAARKARIEQGRAKTVPALVSIGLSEGRASHIVQAREEKERLRSAVVEVSTWLHTATGFGRLRRADIWDMKPKQLRQTVIDLMDKIHEYALSLNAGTEGSQASGSSGGASKERSAISMVQ